MIENLFLTNYTDINFLTKIQNSFKKCNSFTLSVSFIKKAGLVLLEREIVEALERGAKGRIITSTYQNFTDINSLKTFNEWQKKYDNFKCHLDFNCFGDNGFHSKGYLFEYDDSIEIIVGSSNITRFALLKNIEWNVSLIATGNNESYYEAMNDFDYLWERTYELTDDIINKYSILLDYAIEKWDMDYMNPNKENGINPNSMQRKALKELRRYRDEGIKKALIISATGSGKTYLAAFDARNFSPRRLLFIVHRETILKDSRKTFINVFGVEKTCGLFTGNEQDLECDFIFATSSMLSKHLDLFEKDEFDYICFDEVHHIVADGGKKIFNYFKPEFLLGLTATPERMDNKDVFELFEQNVPFELRLREAILNDLVVPFHYYGIRDELLDYGEVDKNKLAKNISDTKNIDFIVKEIEKHKLNNEKLKCVAFCTNIAHCNLMSRELSLKGYNTLSLTGENDTGERLKAFKDLQDETNELEIICTVDILNEGVDIPGINMVLFLRPTESSTIFLQQLGRGLRKYRNKNYLTVLDFIGNDYNRSIQIALALGTLGKTTYTEKSYLKELVKNDFKSIGLDDVIIDIDELSKKEILDYIDKENFNKKAILKKDYENFKNYLNIDTYPKHMDFLESEIAPDLLRFLKVKVAGKRVTSYYNFLASINEENIPLFNEEEIKLINLIEDMLPIVRVDEYLIIREILNYNEINYDKLKQYNNRISDESLNNAISLLIKKGILKDGKLNVNNLTSIRAYLDDLLNYGLSRYDVEFGEFEGKYKLYANYSKEQTITSINKEFKMNILLKGTYIDDNTNEAYIYVGLKKDLRKQERTDYKDKFISSKIFQWESENNTTRTNNIGIKLLNTKNVYLFVRKMDDEDNISLPFTYFGTGKLNNVRESKVIDKKTNDEFNTLLFDIKLHNEVPEEYFMDFEIEKKEDN